MQEIIHYIAYELKASDAALDLLDALETRLYHLHIFRSVQRQLMKNHGETKGYTVCR